MKQINLSVNPAIKADKPMRDILGMNNLPRIGSKKSYPIQKEWFDALKLKFVRHHDASLDNPGQQLLDVSRVFPLFHLDENDPKNYIFNQSDDYMQSLVGYEGEILWDTSKPNGTPRKLLDVSKSAALGWTYKTELEEGIRLSYEDFLNNPMRAER